MKTPFFITGLARSRTTWLSVLFSMGEKPCVHDGIRLCNTWGEYVEMMNSGLFCGDSSSGSILAYEKMVKEWPSAKWLVVKRDPEISAKSTSVFLKIPMDLVVGATIQCQEKLDKICSPFVHQINFSDIDKEVKMRSAWEHLTTEPFPFEKYRLLRDIKIEPMMSKRDYTRGGILCLQ